MTVSTASVPAPRAPADESPRRRRTRVNRPTLDTIKVRDQERILEFRGEKIGHASSEGPQSLRWTEIEVYRTEAGNYVVHRVGVSLVYHRLNGRGKYCRSGQVKLAADLQKIQDVEPCPDCRPPDPDEVEVIGSVRLETDRHSAEAVDSPQNLVRALSLTRDNGMTYLSAVARDVLRVSAERDEALAALTTATVHVA